MVAARRSRGPRAGAAGWVALLAAVAGGVGLPGSAQHAPHTHGVSRLNVAVDGNQLLIEFRAPGADIVGFEHPAETAEDRERVRRAVESLQKGAEHFLPSPEAGCRLSSAEVEAGQAKHESGSGRGHHESPREAPGAERHTEFRAHYRFECRNAGRVPHIHVRLFETFSAMREIEAQYIAPGRQGSAELTPSSPVLNF